MMQFANVSKINRFHLSLFLLISGLSLAVLYTWYPIGVDWEQTFSQVGAHWRNPYVLPTFTSPPWIVALLPHSWLPPRMGNLVNICLNVAALLAVLRRYGGRWQNYALVFTSPAFLHLAGTNNVDWIPLVALLLPPAWGLPLLLVKPQSMGGIALIWLKRHRLKVLLPSVIILAASFLIWGPWFLRLQPQIHVWWNFSPWPWGIPLGLYMLYRAYQSDDEVLAAAATPFLTPYIALYSITAILAILGDKYRREAIYIYVGFWAYAVVESHRLSLLGLL